LPIRRSARAGAGRVDSVRILLAVDGVPPRIRRVPDSSAGVPLAGVLPFVFCSVVPYGAGTAFWQPSWILSHDRCEPLGSAPNVRDERPFAIVRAYQAAWFAHRDAV